MLRRLERKVAEQARRNGAARTSGGPAFPGRHLRRGGLYTGAVRVVDDQPRALRELRRVLRPGGQLLFIEHVRSGDAHLARSQARMNGINRFVVGCDCNRPTLDSIREAGLTITRLEHTTLPKVPKFASPAIVGSAAAPAPVRSLDAQPVRGTRS
jgi:SAM-dependent methyltransferase